MEASPRRLRAALRHLSPVRAAADTGAKPQLVEIILGDEPSRWSKAGFCVGPFDGPFDDSEPAGHTDRAADGIQQAIRLGNVRVLLTGDGRPGLQSLGFTEMTPAAAAAVSGRLPDGVSCHAAAALPDQPTLNHNSVESLAELVLYVSDLDGFVNALADGAGIITNKGYPPKPMKGTPFAQAQYFMQPQLRTLVVGPASPETTEEE